MGTSIAGQKIMPFLWFDRNAEEAANFYVSVFEDSRIVQVTRYGDGMPAPKGTVMTVAFDLCGQRFTALNGGPGFPFTEAISLVVHCDSQAEIDRYWAALTADGGKEVQCSWLIDKYGLRWQIVPRKLWEWMQDPAACERVMNEVVQMVKLDVGRLERAARGG